jgi:hypothetical protein
LNGAEIDPMPISSPPTLNYSAKPKAPGRKWPAILLLLITLFVLQSKFSPISSFRNIWQRWRLTHYSAPADQIVYENDPSLAVALAAKPDYQLYASAPLPKSFAAIHMPAIWKPFTVTGRSTGLIFLHGRQCAAGPMRLVAVQLEPEPSLDGQGRHQAEVVELCYWVYALDPLDRMTLLPSPRGPTNLVAFIPLGNTFELMAGQSDPADAAHFTIDFMINGARNTIDGHLRADDTVLLVPRLRPPGPGAFWQPVPPPTIVLPADH